MNDFITEKHDELYEKLLYIDNLDDVVEDENVASIYDVVCSIDNEMKPFNEVLGSDNREQIDKINKNYYNHKKINSLIFMDNYINSRGNIYVRLFFKDNFNCSVDYILLGLDRNNNIKSINSCYDENETNEFIKNNKSILMKNFDMLMSFRDKYPNVEIFFNDNTKNTYNRKIYSIETDILTCNIDFCYPMNSGVVFTDKEETFYSFEHSKKFGRFYDEYLAPYKERFMKKTPVNIDDLDPLIKEMYINNKNNRKNNNLTLSIK